jgi:hypothetical protein
MYVTGTQYGYLYLWSQNDVPKLVKIQRNDNLLCDILTKSQVFFKECVLPELISRKQDPTLINSIMCKYSNVRI